MELGFYEWLSLSLLTSAVVFPFYSNTAVYVAARLDKNVTEHADEIRVLPKSMRWLFDPGMNMALKHYRK